MIRINLKETWWERLKYRHGCHGCSQYHIDPNECMCERPPKYNGRICPCVMCPVKVMCGDACRPYETYHHYIINDSDVIRGLKDRDGNWTEGVFVIEK